MKGKAFRNRGRGGSVPKVFRCRRPLRFVGSSTPVCELSKQDLQSRLLGVAVAVHRDGKAVAVDNHGLHKLRDVCARLGLGRVRAVPRPLNLEQRWRRRCRASLRGTAAAGSTARRQRRDQGRRQHPVIDPGCCKAVVRVKHSSPHGQRVELQLPAPVGAAHCEGWRHPELLQLGCVVVLRTLGPLHEQHVEGQESINVKPPIRNAGRALKHGVNPTAAHTAHALVRVEVLHVCQRDEFRPCGVDDREHVPAKHVGKLSRQRWRLALGGRQQVGRGQVGCSWRRRRAGCFLCCLCQRLCVCFHA